MPLRFSKLFKTLNVKHPEMIEKPHFLFTPENPKFPERAIEQPSVEALLNRLKNEGLNVYPVKGKYGQPENSIAVYGVEPQVSEDLHQLASRLGQDSSIYSTGKKHEMRYHGPDKSGMSNYGEGTTWHSSEPDDLYTTLPSGEHFTHSINFDELLKSGLLRRK